MTEQEYQYVIDSVTLFKLASKLRLEILYEDDFRHSEMKVIRIAMSHDSGAFTQTFDNVSEALNYVLGIDAVYQLQMKKEKKDWGRLYMKDDYEKMDFNAVVDAYFYFFWGGLCKRKDRGSEMKRFDLIKSMWRILCCF